jgi:hypothetical protein
MAECRRAIETKEQSTSLSQALNTEWIKVLHNAEKEFLRKSAEEAASLVVECIRNQGIHIRELGFDSGIGKTLAGTLI